MQGILAAIPLAYILPALCYLRLEEGHVLARKKLPAMGVAFFGLIVTLLGLIFIVVDIDEVGSCSHGMNMPYCASNDTKFGNQSIDFSSNK